MFDTQVSDVPNQQGICRQRVEAVKVCDWSLLCLTLSLQYAGYINSTAVSRLILPFVSLTLLSNDT